MFPDKIPQDLHTLVNSVNISRQLLFPCSSKSWNNVSPVRILILGALKALDASKRTYLDYTTLSSLVARFGACLHIVSTLLKAECEQAKILIADGRNIDPDLYPNLFKVVTISKTLLVGTATEERSFSAMNRILNWACNSLDSSLANDFMLLSMNNNLLKRINLDKVLDR